MLDNLWRLVFCRSVSDRAPTATRVFFVSKFLHYTFDLLLCVQNRRRRRRRRWRWWWNSGRASSRHGWCRIRPDIRHLKHAPTCRFPRISSCVATITHCLRPSLAQLFSTSNRQPRERERETDCVRVGCCCSFFAGRDNNQIAVSSSPFLYIWCRTTSCTWWGNLHSSCARCSSFRPSARLQLKDWPANRVST